ncbi:MAG: complex I subunit 5 family protein [Halanaerobiaceae bacterium]
MSGLVLALVFLPLVTVILIIVLNVFKVKLPGPLVFLSIAGEFLFALYIMVYNFSLIREGEFVWTGEIGGEWLPLTFLNITFTLDTLGLIFSFMVSLALFLLVLYSLGFMDFEDPGRERRFYIYLFLVLAAMQGALLTGDIFSLFIFIELVTIFTAPLVAFNRSQEAVDAAIKYLFFGLAGGVFFFLGLVLLYFSLGTVNMAEIASSFSSLDIGIQLMVIGSFVLSLLIKLGIFPFHFWIPLAHSICPAPISALLSGVLLKIYIYIFVRMLWIVLDFSLLVEYGIDDVIIYLCLFSSLLGHVFALQMKDLKKMLAYSTVGNMGMLIAVAVLNTSAALYAVLLHMIGHIMMKSSLFTGAGYLLDDNHNIKQLRGKGPGERYIFGSFVVSGLSMAGFPPLIGFIGKWYILLAFLSASHHVGALVVLAGGIISLLYYLRCIYRGYSGKAPKKRKKNHRGWKVKTVIYSFTLLVLLLGIFYHVLDIPLNIAVEELMHPVNYIQLVN